MNENAKKWVEALRSGEFDQTEGHLRDDTGYCCLGVACELYHRETGKGAWEERDPANFIFRTSHSSSQSVLPAAVRAWLNLRYDDGSYAINGTGRGADGLALRNDRGASFAKIADIIESEPEGLFGG